MQSHYQRKKQYYKDKANKRRLQTMEWYHSYKENLKCEECGENHPALLDFHHKDSSKKDLDLSAAVNNAWSVKRLLKEIEKCSVLCCKCHRLLHYNEKSGPWVWRK